MAVQHRLMTVEEFWEQYADKPYELINGEVVETVPTGLEHGSVAIELASLLNSFVKSHRLGQVVVGETGIRLGPDTLRAADIAFVSREKLAAIKDRRKFLPFAPDLAVEIVSPTNTANEIQLKVDQYLAAGVRLVWVVYPDIRKVVVHESAGAGQSVGENGTLDGGDVLPGLAIPVADLFPPAQSA